MAQFCAGMDVPVSLSESQQEVLNIWNNLDEKEQNLSLIHILWIELKAEGSALFVWQSLSILLIRRK